MSNAAMNHLKTLNIPRRCRMLAMAIGDFANQKTRVCFASVKTLAKACGCSEATVKRQLNLLEDLGIIERIAQFRDNGSQSTNTINLVGFTEKAEPAKQGGANCAPGGSICAGEGRNLYRGRGAKTTPLYPLYEPLDEPLSSIVADSPKIDSNELHAKLVEAGGAALCPMAKAVQLNSVNDVIGWINAGAVFETDILPTVRIVATKAAPASIVSWRYFAKAVSSAKHDRERGLPPPAVRSARPSNAHMVRY